MAVISVENLSKLYDLGQVGTGTLSKDMNRWWAKVRRKPDPYAKLGRINDRTQKSAKDDSIWAVKDVNFSVNEGDVIGIIGRNGAGKSTLLKLISRITTPTSGMIKIKGRIAALLEVGTGFHPEMTGRENIFMNGTLLGMTRREIQRKLDDIVEFAGVSMYVDTPVKRYSSGMQVRLGFAVGAFLEPEILIVDEVLAVGDVDFQRKSIGKMDEVAKEGRTVLFVSHNMNSIEKLCTRALLLDKGTVGLDADVKSCINKYSSEVNLRSSFTFGAEDGDDEVNMLKIELLNSLNDTTIRIKSSEESRIVIDYRDLSYGGNKTAILHLKDSKGNTIFASNEHSSANWDRAHSSKGHVRATCILPKYLLQPGVYSILLAVGSYGPNVINFKRENVLSFEIIETETENIISKNYNGVWPGIIKPLLRWESEKF